MSGRLPAGAANDPRAPYNQVDDPDYCNDCGVEVYGDECGECGCYDLISAEEKRQDDLDNIMEDRRRDRD